VAEPLPSNILEWHYVVRGPEKSPYDGGHYHGKLVFPSEFPFKPPSIYMITPNGRFKTNTRLCLSISDYHPDTWNPAWSVSTILTGLLSFMLEKSPTLGSIETTLTEKRYLAEQSAEFNLADKTFCELFADMAEELKQTIERRKSALEQAANQASSGSAVTSENATGARAFGPLAGDLGPRIRAADYTGMLANIVVIAGFTLFAFVVKYVLRNISVD